METITWSMTIIGCIMSLHDLSNDNVQLAQDISLETHTQKHQTAKNRPVYLASRMAHTDKSVWHLEWLSKSSLSVIWIAQTDWSDWHLEGLTQTSLLASRISHTEVCLAPRMAGTDISRGQTFFSDPKYPYFGLKITKTAFSPTFPRGWV